MFCNRVRRGAATGDISLYQRLSNLGLTTNLQICLDAGSADSYTSGQTWYDLTANSNDYYLGTTSGSESQDPTFNGRPGGLSSSEYFLRTGGKPAFTLAGSAPAWMAGTFKNNAKVSVCGWVYVPTATYAALGASDAIITFLAGQSDELPSFLAGFAKANTDEGQLLLQLTNDSSAILVRISLGDGVTDPGDRWSFFSISYDESGSNGNTKWRINDTSATDGQTPGASSFSSTSSGITSIIGGGNNVRIAQLAVWDEYITPANMTAIYNATKPRYGL